MTEKKSFVLYLDYQNQINLLSNEEAGILFKAIFEYENGNKIELFGSVGMAFAFIKATLDRDKKKYQARLERNKTNGLKGGRPSKEPTTSDTQENPVGFLGFQNNPQEPNVTQRNPLEPKKPDSGNDSVSDNGTDSGSGTDSDILPNGNRYITPCYNLSPTDPGFFEIVEMPESEKLAHDIQTAFDLYNRLARECGLRTANKLDADRKSSFANRFQEIGGLAGWEIALERVRRSKFCQGHGKNKWRIDLTDLLNKTKMKNLLEGRYDDWVEPKPDYERVLEALANDSFVGGFDALDT